MCISYDQPAGTEEGETSTPAGLKRHPEAQWPSGHYRR
jgi:hypothetical protein